MADPDLWAQRPSYEAQSPAMWDALMQAAPQRDPSLWPDAQPAPNPVERDAFEAAALTTRRPYRNIAAPGSSPLGQFADKVTSLPSWLERATEQSAKDRAAFQSGGVPALMADTTESQDLASGFFAGTIGGKLAKTADLAALARAEGMAAKGVPAEQIWKDTGWFTGADNKWRFEIPDTGSKWTTDPKLNSMVAGDKPTPISQTLSHPELYEAYPQLRDADLNMMGRPTGYKGMYQAGSEGSPSTITLAPGSPASMRSTALHELQHGVQDIEGFARGGNTIGLRPGTPAWDIYQERLTAMKTPLDKYTYGKVAGFGMNVPNKEYQKYLKIVRNPSPVADQAAQQYGVENAYRRQAGEVEARNVQTRADYTPEQLRSLFPPSSEDVLRENQFVNLKGDGPLFSAPRDPNLWSPISDIRLRKPLAEMEHRYTDVRAPVPKIVDPKDMVGGNLILTPWDLSATGKTATHIDNIKLPRPVEAQGGVGFPEANPGMAAASELAISRRLDNQAARLAEEGKPVYIAPMTMSPTGIDASHHVADPLSQLVQMSKIKRADASAFNEMMRKEVPDWVSINSPKFQDYINNLKGGMTTKALMAEKMGLREWQDKGFPDVAAVRHAMTEPSLIDVPRNTSGMAISEYIPGKGLLDTLHNSYPKGVAGQHIGQLPHLLPFDVAAPDIAKGLAARNAENLAAGKKTTIQPAYHMGRPTEGVPTHQVLDNEWLDRIMRFFEMKGR